MKVEKTNVHRLSVERDCGCRAVREFRDPQYKDAIAEAIYSPCKKHKANKDLSDMMGMILVEDVNREAESLSAVPVPPTHLHPIPVTTSLDGSSGETVTSIPITRPRPRVQVAPASGGGGAPVSQNGPRRDPTQVRTINRDHNVGRRATAAGRTPVTGVTVTNPAGARRPNTVQIGEVELETPGMDILDMDGVAEDPRVTQLAESALLPDLEDDPSQA